MKLRTGNIFSRIGAFMFIMISVLSVLFMYITFISTTHFYEASPQLLNKDVAAHIAKFTSPFEEKGINKHKADSVFYNAMVINPSDEVYFLDTTGKVMDYHAPDSLIKMRQLPLDQVQTHIRNRGDDYIKGPDPKDPTTLKIFSAAEVTITGKKLGYIYVILGSDQYRNVTDLLTKSHIAALAVEAFVIITFLSLLFTFLYLKRTERNFNDMIQTIEKFKDGNYEARFDTGHYNEFDSIMIAFNGLADRLHQTIGRLKQSEDERRDFITNISHDLRTPLAVAKGFTETLLLRKKTDHESIEHLQLIENKIQVVENLVMQLFELSKMESVEFKAHREPFIIAEVLKEITNSWQLPAQAKNIKLECFGCEENYMVFADISMMEKVFRNLLGNAIKYTPENGFITVQLLKYQQKLVLSFTNNGPMVPKDVVEWISNETKDRGIIRRPVKSGLGLAIVKRILELHDFTFVITAETQNQFTITMGLYVTPWYLL